MMEHLILLQFRCKFIIGIQQQILFMKGFLLRKGSWFRQSIQLGSETKLYILYREQIVFTLKNRINLSSINGLTIKEEAIVKSGGSLNKTDIDGWKRKLEIKNDSSNFTSALQLVI
ncbi:hypothetical protein A6E02_08490 [Aliivibrio fischeri]|nr:hypothetical protein A6E02_08490 [Aliivibrio fischeri]